MEPKTSGRYIGSAKEKQNLLESCMILRDILHFLVNRWLYDPEILKELMTIKNGYDTIKRNAERL